VIDFDQWLMNQLFPELNHTQPSDLIQRRRIAWLIGEWVPIKVEAESRPPIYQALVALMRPEESMIVRMTAAQSLRHCVNDWGFESDGFLPYLKETVDSIAQLLAQMEGAERRMAVMNCLASIVERMETQASHSMNAYILSEKLIYAIDCTLCITNCSIITTIMGCS
jgi:hypothetical protein